MGSSGVGENRPEYGVSIATSSVPNGLAAKMLAALSSSAKWLLVEGLEKQKSPLQTARGFLILD